MHARIEEGMSIVETSRESVCATMFLDGGLPPALVASASEDRSWSITAAVA
jgi:hypothetical protein